MPIGKASALMLVILRVAGGKPNHSVFEELLRKYQKMLSQNRNLVLFGCLSTGIKAPPRNNLNK
jgi:hypothetical protein